MIDKTVLTRLADEEKESINYYLNEIELSKDNKEKDMLLKLYLKTRQEYSNLRELIVSRIFENTNEGMNEKVYKIESEIKDIIEVLPKGWGDTNFEVILEDSIVIIDRKEINRYGLDTTDKFKIAIVIAYLHMGE